jgi:hypothetical protein
MWQRAEFALLRPPHQDGAVESNSRWPQTFEAAKALGLTVPKAILLNVHEVIE